MTWELCSSSLGLFFFVPTKRYLLHDKPEEAICTKRDVEVSTHKSP